MEAGALMIPELEGLQRLRFIQAVMLIHDEARRGGQHDGFARGMAVLVDYGEEGVFDAVVDSWNADVLLVKDAHGKWTERIPWRDVRSRVAKPSEPFPVTKQELEDDLMAHTAQNDQLERVKKEMVETPEAAEHSNFYLGDASTDDVRARKWPRTERPIMRSTGRTRAQLKGWQDTRAQLTSRERIRWWIWGRSLMDLEEVRSPSRAVQCVSSR